MRYYIITVGLILPVLGLAGRAVSAGGDLSPTDIRTDNSRSYNQHDLTEPNPVQLPPRFKPPEPRPEHPAPRRPFQPTIPNDEQYDQFDEQFTDRDNEFDAAIEQNHHLDESEPPIFAQPPPLPGKHRPDFGFIMPNPEYCSELRFRPESCLPKFDRKAINDWEAANSWTANDWEALEKAINDSFIKTTKQTVSQEPKIQFTANPTDVTIFIRGQALVLRTGVLTLPPGRSVVYSTALPPTVDIDSLQATAQSADNNDIRVIVESVESRRLSKLNPDELDARRREEYAKIEEQEHQVFLAQLEYEYLDETCNALQRQRQLIEDLTNDTQNDSALNSRNFAGWTRFPAEQWHALFDSILPLEEVLTERIYDLATELNTAEKHLEKESEILAELKQQYSYFSGNASETQAIITLRHSSESPLAVQLRLQYRVSNASWQPNYRVNAKLSKKQLVLDAFGAVVQETGEDWDNVNLILSTARPDLGLEVPKLEPWILRAGDSSPPSPPTYENRQQLNQPMSEFQAADFDNQIIDPDSDLAAPMTTAFIVKESSVIPSGPNRRQIPLASMESDFVTKYIAVPRVSTFAFVEATCTTGAKFPLLSGAVDVVVDNFYAGRSLLKATAPGQKLQLGLGIDEKVKMQLEVLNNQADSKTRAERIQVTNIFRINAANYSTNGIELTIIDQLPVSESPDISVIFGTETRKALRGNEFPGQLQWTKKLAAGQVESWEYDFTLDYPQRLSRSVSDNWQLKYRQSNVVYEQGKAVQRLNYESVAPAAAIK